MIQERLRQGVYVKDIAAELGVHPRTVSRARQRGDAPARRRPMARASKLDAYKPEIDRLLVAGVWNAAVILREIQAQGYQGQASILRDYIRPKRPLRQARATVRFETAPGEQLQNDWAQYRTQVNGRMREVHFAVNTLGYSRRFHFVAMACEDAEHTYESLIQTFEYFGGVTNEVLVDNQKTEVISHRVGAAVEYNARFLELAAHYGFQPRACRPRRARTKGKDERMVRYIKRTSSPATASSKAWPISINSPSAGCARRPISGCMAPSRKWSPSVLPVSCRCCTHCQPAALILSITNGGWSHGMAISRCAATAIAYRPNYAERWLKCASDSTAD